MRAFFGACALVCIAIGLGLYITREPERRHVEAYRLQDSERPADSTCTAPKGWTAQIEKAKRGWACVMRDNKKQAVMAFYYL